MKRWMKLKSWLTAFVIVFNLLIGNIILADECDDIAEILRKSELAAPSNAKLSDHKLEQVALLSKDVESKREKYARSLGLFLEKIGADKDVDQNRIDYEKAQIKLGDFWHKTRDTLEILKKQEHLTQGWKKKAAESIGKPVSTEPSTNLSTTGNDSAQAPTDAINQPVAQEIKNTLRHTP